jgi:hypothetical protein
VTPHGHSHARLNDNHAARRKSAKRADDGNTHDIGFIFRLFPAPMIGRYNKRDTGWILVVRPPLMKLGQAEFKPAGEQGAPPQAAEKFLPAFLVCGRRAEPETRPMLDLLEGVPNDA